MNNIDSVLKKIRYRRDIRSRETDSLGNELAKLQRRQRYLWDHGEDSDVPEYESNIEKIQVLTSEIRSRIGKDGRIQHRVINQGVKNV